MVGRRKGGRPSRQRFPRRAPTTAPPRPRSRSGSTKCPGGSMGGTLPQGTHRPCRVRTDPRCSHGLSARGAPVPMLHRGETTASTPNAACAVRGARPGPPQETTRGRPRGLLGRATWRLRPPRATLRCPSSPSARSPGLLRPPASGPCVRHAVEYGGSAEAAGAPPQRTARGSCPRPTAPSPHSARRGSRTACTGRAFPFPTWGGGCGSEYRWGTCPPLEPRRWRCASC